MLHDVKWFEMNDLKKRSLTRASWIPLCAYDDSRIKGDYGYLGYEKEYFGAVSILFPANESEKALELQWMDVSPRCDHRPYVENDNFFPAGKFSSFKNELVGDYPVLQQFFETGESSVWYLTQDIILGLKLYREGDIWTRPDEDYLKIAQIQRSSTGKPLHLKIRAEQLRDFLCAKRCGLLVSTYQSREVIIETLPDFGWHEGRSEEKSEQYRWQGSIIPISEGGNPYGSKTAVFHVGRKNMDFGDDVPTYGFPGEDEFEHNSWEIEHKGTKIFRVIGEMWRNEGIAPADQSPRVRGDRIESKVHFIVDASGTTLSGQSLIGHNGWLWFKPEVVLTLLNKRRGFLRWYTEDTGEVGPAPLDGVHFGVNELGLINVLAKDISLLPEIYQNFWVTHNIAPDGGVSKELLMSQMEANPANTTAPETLLSLAVEHLQTSSTRFLGRRLLKEHSAVDEILQNIHRFNGHSIEGIYFLSKELTRLITERLDIDLLRELEPTANKNFRSIKLLSHFLTSKGFSGHKITGPLVGAYELRMADAHLPSEDIAYSLKLLGLQDIEDYQQMAKQAIRNVAISVGTIGDIIIKIYHKD